MFINPEKLLIAISAGDGYSKTGSFGPVPVISESPRAFAVETLADMKLDKSLGLRSDCLDLLRFNAEALVKQDRRDEQARIEKEARYQRWRERRGPQQERIRELMRNIRVWRESDALLEIRAYFGEYLRGRIDEVTSLETWQEPTLSHWQCAIYFELIAGQSNPFSVPQAAKAIRDCSAGLNAAEDWRSIAGYLHNLKRQGYVAVSGSWTAPLFTPTESGAWW